MTRRRAAWSTAVLLVIVGLTLALRPFVRPESERPLDAGPVVALGSAPGRVVLAAELATGDGDRPLVLSHPPLTERDPGGRCAAASVRCIFPEPVSTWGEAQAVARLAREEGWTGVTVVTDDFHLRRSRSLFRRCLDVPVRLVGTGDGRRVPIGLAAREGLATLVSAVVYRDC